MQESFNIESKNTKNMGFLCHLLFFLSLFLCTSPAESVDPLVRFCNTNTNITSKISANIHNLLPQLVKGTLLNGYISTSYGKGKDTVYGLSQCRVDVSYKDCSSCIQNATKEIRKRCPNEADARIWYEFCFLRYDIKNFSGDVDTSFAYLIPSFETVDDLDSFNKALGTLMDQITSQAIVSGNRGDGRGKNKFSSFQTIYGLVQCTRDLSTLSCAQCLFIAVSNIPNFCKNSRGCQILYSSCFLRYEFYPFYFPLNSQEGTANASMAYYVTVVSKP